MSSYYAKTKHPITGEWKPAEWLDDYFERHNYGVRFDGESEIYDPRERYMPTEMEATAEKAEPTPFTPKRGDRVLAWDDGDDDPRSYIFLTTIEGATYPHYVVTSSEEEKFSTGKEFSVEYFERIGQVVKTTLTKAEVADRLGISVEELEITE